MNSWNPKQARDTYNTAHWGAGHVDISDEGHLLVIPRPNRRATAVDLYKLVDEIHARGMTLPVLVRFIDILHDRVDALCEAFAGAMQQDAYEGRYQAIYPIKVNQQHSVVDAIFEHGHGRVGLEAGSKPELMAVLGLADNNGGVIVCNGYKDREYIRLALIGRMLGHRIYIVIEKLSELSLVLSESNKLGVAPLIGMRVRLASIGAGKWQNTGGEKSKFGLSAAQLLTAIQQLRDAGQLDALQMLHFHLGSQIPNIRDIQRGMRECARYYAELHRMGVNVRVVDVGGGLGIDYEGSRSRSFCSMNYTLEEYAHNVVHALWEVCQEQDLPQPDIFSESGRALTAHHAVLITNVIDTTHLPEGEDLREPGLDAPLILHDMWRAYQALVLIEKDGGAPRSVVEIYHDLQYGLSEVQGMYNHGVLSLAQRAFAEDIYYAACRALRDRLQSTNKQHQQILEELHEKLADKYFCNFSLFQSLPDVWAIDQIFPIVPLHRLDEPPSRRAVIEDITCDSDGRIDYYVDEQGIESTLPLHPIINGQPYLLGMFLVGAYQEILGDMHNLFGDTAAVDVKLDEAGGYELVHATSGDNIDAVLRYVHFDIDDLRARYEGKIHQAGLSDERKAQFLEELQNGLYGYTYLED